MTPLDRSEPEDRTVLVTGATGFIGSHLVRRLVQDGARVHVLCRHQSDFWRLTDVLPEIDRHLMPLEDPIGLRRVIQAVRPHSIFHLASATVVAGSAAAASDLVNVNLLGTVNLLDACEDVDYGALVITGDSFEYSAGHEPLSESDACRPNTLHGISKLGATLHAQAMASAHGRPIVALRLFSTYGPGDHPKRLVPRVIAGALAGAKLTLSRPDIARDWVFVEDIVGLYLEAAEKASKSAGGVFNAGSGESTDLGQIVKTILRLTGSSAEAGWGLFDAPEHDRYPWIADMRHTFETFHWRPTTNLETGLRATIASIRNGATP